MNVICTCSSEAHVSSCFPKVLQINFIYLNNIYVSSLYLHVYENPTAIRSIDLQQIRNLYYDIPYILQTGIAIHFFFVKIIKLKFLFLK